MAGEEGRPMTEAEWLACTDPGAMLKFSEKRPLPPRKYWLFSCLGARRSSWMQEPGFPLVVEMAERVAEGVATVEELYQANAPLVPDPRLPDGSFRIYREPLRPLDPMFFRHPPALAWATTNAFKGEPNLYVGQDDPNLWESQLIRELIGNPFRPVTVEPAWRTATVTSLAQAIYEERAFDRLPILADALEDAGCTSADILGHCRGAGEHVRGCWVVDLVLGKA
jgi:hypothetical protein